MVFLVYFDLYWKLLLCLEKTKQEAFLKKKKSLVQNSIFVVEIVKVMNLIFKFQLHILNTESKIWFLTNFRSRSEKEDDTSNDYAIDDDINWAENFKSLAGILIEVLVFHQRFEILCTIYVFIHGILILISLNKVNFRL